MTIVVVLLLIPVVIRIAWLYLEALGILCISSVAVFTERHLPTTDRFLLVSLCFAALVRCVSCVAGLYVLCIGVRAILL